MILYQKLYDIDKNSRQTISKSVKPVFQFKKSQREVYVKNEIKTLAQENLFILKKLLNKNSEYSALKFEKDYKQSRKYKNNICHYPSIDFSSQKTSTNNSIIESYDFNHINKNRKNETINYKLPKIGGITIKSNYRAFHTTNGGPLDRRYYKEAAKRSSKMSGTIRTNYQKTKYNHNNKKKTKEATNIDEESNEGSSSGKNESGDEKSDSNSGEGSGDGSGDGSASGSGSGDGMD